MSAKHVRRGAVLERHSGSAFLAAGGLLLITTIINGVDVFTPVETQSGLLLWLEGLTGFGGVVLLFVGLLGLYPRLADPAPQLSRVGILLAVGPTTFFSVVVVACSVLAPLVGFPSLKALVPSFVTIIGSVLLLFAVSLTVFGVASLRTGVPSRLVAGLLLALAGAWYVFFGVTWVYAPNTPVWVTFVQSMLMAVPTVSIGYRLRTATRRADHSVSPAAQTV